MTAISISCNSDHTSTGVSTTDVLAMLSDEPQRIDLVPLGGVGLADAG
jgi:hypothetical protein